MQKSSSYPESPQKQSAEYTHGINMFGRGVQESQISEDTDTKTIAFKRHSAAVTYQEHIGAIP